MCGAQQQLAVAPPSLVMAAAAYRARDVQPRYYGHAASKAAAVGFAEEVLYYTCPSKQSIIHRIILSMRKVMRSVDVWDSKVGFVSLGKFAPAGSVLLWPHMRFSQAS